MITSVIRHEFVGTLRDGRFRWAAVFVGLLLIAALVAGWSYQREQAEQRALATASEDNRWLTQPAKNPHSAAHYGIWAFKPSLATSFIDPGVEPYAGVAVWLEAHRQNQFLHKPADDASAAQRFGDLTAALVLQLLVPLLVVILAFGSVASERERGTLRQALACGGNATPWMWGKALGLAAALGLLLLPLLVAGGALLLFQRDNVVVNGAWLRFALLIASYAAYLGIFVLGTLAVSALAPSARVALVASLGLWMFNGLLLPRAMAEIAGARHPTMEGVTFRTELRAKLDDPHARSPRLERLQAEMMQRYKVTRPEDLPLHRGGLNLLASEETSDAVYDELFGRAFGQIEAQNRMQRAAGWFAPLGALQPLSLALAGTDFAHHRHFITAAETHRRLMQRMLNTDLMLNGPRDGSVYLADPKLWHSIPKFDYRPPSLREVLQDRLASLAGLAGWFAVAIAAFLHAARRLNPI
ncbi:MAG: DUF3526 domain-containing protein [Verrucomicrobia bacterium]|nr:DUF3526 domain-containing protein [Verrucomicrobiota bacterium]